MRKGMTRCAHEARKEEKMALSIGQVVKRGDGFTGNIRTALVRGALHIKPNAQKTQGSKQPDYRLYFDGQECGAGWLAEEKPGMDYRSINCTLDDPSFPTPLRFALGRAPDQDDADLLNLIWNRQTPQ